MKLHNDMISYFKFNKRFYTLFFVLFFWMTGGSTFSVAQNQNKNQTLQKSNLSPEKRAELISTWMDNHLNLSPEQYKEVKALNYKYARKNENLHKEYVDSRLKLARKLKRSNQRKERKLRKFLSDEQWEIYIKDKKRLINAVQSGEQPVPEPVADYIQIHQNIVYARNKNAETYLNSLDIYSNSQFAQAPVIVFAHGGAWRFGDKRRTWEKIPAFVDSGYVFVSINYRLSPDVKHPAHVNDLAAALDWVYQKIDNYGGNPDNIVLIGHSAGANMVAQVATDHSYLRAKNVPFRSIKGIVALDGAGYDIERVFESERDRVKKIYRKAFGNDRETWRQASPVNHVQAGKYIPPFLLLYAGHRTMSEQAAQRLGTKLEQTGHPAKLIHYPEENHSSLNRELGKPSFKPTKDVFRFIHQVTQHTEYTEQQTAN